ncbi:hypothetical protein IQ251_04225 [Saccharopolyspora sp. HNM0983]|uniref:DUF5602 domain-containing protein n=1 Tax=Saccharopolyspora montiporae TaxID=2781240 RepID=A0A929B5N4_9PSEU|nr:hypothetical protein [Saccharopolyspora sp. HNM0983]MBE9373652.1 hypothetical protein [Saccharopolyspora sp. HNM0983]
MLRAVRAAALATALAATSAAAPAAGETPSEQVAVCLVAAEQPAVERTVHVPPPAAEHLVQHTPSYAGPCAEYGESAPRGDGTMTAYSQVEDGRPVAVGTVLEAGALRGLPYDPPTEGRWCFDKDGDGHTDPHTECAGGYENALDLGAEFTGGVDTPFTYVLVNWNPHGHMPPGVYDLPHFDVHFYTNPDAERLAIRPGPCEALVNCDDYELGKNLPEQRYRTQDHLDLDALEPAMGNHLVDTTGPEHHGERFTHAFLYGVWDAEVTFYEPMVTHEWLAGLVDGTRQDGCFPIKQPQAWQRDGWHPTSYCLRYRDNREELTVSVEDFAYRRAS